MVTTAFAFDTLAYVKKLVFVGVSKKQAEAQAEALASLVNENLATKQDIKELDLKIEGVKKDIELSKRDIIIKLTSILGTMIIVCFTILGSLIVLLSK